nr:hypothetical protein [uncultured Neokomagataea sp.]
MPNATEAHILRHAIKHFANMDTRHFLDHHIQYALQNTFGSNLIRALGRCEQRLPGSGIRLLNELLNIPADQHKDIERKTERFEQVMQKLAEISAINTIINMTWPEGTYFSIEPKGTNGAKPDLLVRTPSGIYLFEIKCPCFILDRTKKTLPLLEIVVRNKDLNEITGSFDGNIILPKDNKLCDFLKSAARKFSGFEEETILSNILILFWDEDMYQAISPLIDPECGIFTNNTWIIDADGNQEMFTNVDGIILLNRYDSLSDGTINPPLIHTPDPFCFSPSVELRNVWLPNKQGFLPPQNILDAFGAAPIEYFKGNKKYMNVIMVSKNR